MTRLQEVRSTIANCQKRLRELHSSLENQKKIAGLGIAEVMMRELAQTRIPILEREFEKVHLTLWEAELEESRLVFARMPRR